MTNSIYAKASACRFHHGKGPFVHGQPRSGASTPMISPRRFASVAGQGGATMSFSAVEPDGGTPSC